jgi:hypothetical protein
MFNGPEAGDLILHCLASKFYKGADKVKNQPRNKLQMSKDEQVKSDFVIEGSIGFVIKPSNEGFNDNRYQANEDKVAKVRV